MLRSLIIRSAARHEGGPATTAEGVAPHATARYAPARALVYIKKAGFSYILHDGMPGSELEYRPVKAGWLVGMHGNGLRHHFRTIFGHSCGPAAIFSCQVDRTVFDDCTVHSEKYADETIAEIH